jgi:hypothetical protein
MTSSSRELVAAAGQEGDFGSVVGQLDGPVIRHPRLRAPADPAQQIGAGRLEGVVAVEAEPGDGSESPGDGSRRTSWS